MTEIQEGTVIEVVLNTQPLGDEDVEIRDPSLTSLTLDILAVLHSDTI